MRVKNDNKQFRNEAWDLLTCGMTVRLQQLTAPLLERLLNDCSSGSARLSLLPDEQKSQGARMRNIPARRRARALRSLQEKMRPPKSIDSGQEAPEDGGVLLDMVLRLINVVQNMTRSLPEMQTRHEEYQRWYALAKTPSERRSRILEYLHELGSSGLRLMGDRRALHRYLDHDAVNSRYDSQYTREEQYLAFALERLGVLTQSALEQVGDSGQQAELWYRCNIESLAFPLLNYKRDSRVRLAAFKCLATALKGLPVSMQEGSVQPESLQHIFRAAMDERGETWVQCEALDLLQSVSATSLKTVLSRRLNRPVGGDDLFVRKHAVTLLGRNIERMPELNELFSFVAGDPSPFVRQEFVHALTQVETGDLEHWLYHLAIKDEAKEVRAVAVRKTTELIKDPSFFECSIRILKDVLSHETDSFVLRTALQAVADGHESLVRGGGPSGAWRQVLLPEVESLSVGAEVLLVRRWAAIALQRLLTGRQPDELAIKDGLIRLIEPLHPGEQIVCRDDRITICSDEDLAMILSSIAQYDFGFEMRRRGKTIYIRRGDRFGFRLWRLIYEWRHSSPDKRQGCSHTIGRIYCDPIQVPSALLGELTRTRVPGEPLLIGEEGDWRGHLPLTDLALSSLFDIKEAEVRIVTPVGITRMTRPAGLVARLRAWWKLTWHFSFYADLRNWQESSGTSPGSYIASLRELGYEVEFESRTSGGLDCASGDDSVIRAFRASREPTSGANDG